MAPNAPKLPKKEGLAGKLTLTMILVALSGWFYSEIIPPPPKICGFPGGPPGTAPRIRLKDGRFLAYSETGVPKNKAKFKIVIAHGFIGLRTESLGASNKTVWELGAYMVGYDRAGYGESDPNPNRSVKREALDIGELADALGLGPKFFVFGFSLGGYAVWGSLKYIPNRLAGAVLLAPVVNYRWPGFPKNISAEGYYYMQEAADRWPLIVAYYTPWLLTWWLKQPWQPTPTVFKDTTFLPNRLDAMLRDHRKSTGLFEERLKLVTQQGIHESLYRDILVMFGKWEFDPMDLPPAPVHVHLWQGDEDGLVPVTLQRYISTRLPWITYHELPMTGHFLSAVPGFGDNLLKTVLLQQQLN